VCLPVSLRSLLSVPSSVNLMSPSYDSVVRSPFVISGLVVFGRLPEVVGGLGEMFRSFLVVFRCFLRHELFLHSLKCHAKWSTKNALAYNSSFCGGVAARWHEISVGKSAKLGKPRLISLRLPALFSPFNLRSPQNIEISVLTCDIRVTDPSSTREANTRVTREQTRVDIFLNAYHRPSSVADMSLVCALWTPIR
jgi:hypothetical protein